MLQSFPSALFSQVLKHGVRVGIGMGFGKLEDGIGAGIGAGNCAEILTIKIVTKRKKMLIFIFILFFFIFFVDFCNITFFIFDNKNWG
jgi:hypothetical protein